MLLDIRPDYLQIVQDILQKHVPQYEVWAFGSRAKWTAKEYSDLDLCIVSDKPLSFTVLGALGEDFSESDLPWKVDVVDWATTSPSFRKIIERDKVALQQPVLSGGTEIWRKCTLGEIAIFKAGSAFKTNYQGKTIGTYPFIKVSDMNLPGNEYKITRANNWIDKTELKAMSATLHPKGATVFAKIGVALTTNRRRILTRETVVDNNMMSAMPCEEKVLPKFLYYLLTIFDFNTISQGSALPYVNVSDLQKVSITLPPISEQIEICSILDALDDKVFLLRETNATLEAIAQALFKSWFVNFDPVRAKAVGREPEGISPEIAVLFPSEFEDSALGKIPKGWEVKPLSEITTVITKGTTPTQEDISSAPSTDAQVN